MPELRHRGIIKDIDEPGDPFIYFDFFDPPQGSGGNAEWVETPIRLRSEPHQTYVQTSAWSVSLTGKIVASVEQGDERTGQDVKDDLAFLYSLEYPDYGEGEGLVKPPHRARVYLEGSVNHIGLLKGLTPTYMGIVDAFGDPLAIEVAFTFVAINDPPLSYMDVRRPKTEIKLL